VRNCFFAIFALFLTGCGVSIAIIDPDPGVIESIEKLDSDKRLAIRNISDERDMQPDLIGFVQTGIIKISTPLCCTRQVSELVRDVLENALQTAGVGAESVETADYLVDVDIQRFEFFEVTGSKAEYGFAFAEMDATFVGARTETQILSISISENLKVKRMDVTTMAEGVLRDVIQASAEAFIEGVKELVALPSEELRQTDEDAGE
jgi:hypothetical protein